MGLFMPQEIQSRILQFIDGKLTFPFVRNDEIVGVFFLFGKNGKITNKMDILSARDLARNGMNQITKEVNLCNSISNRTTFDFVRENYTRRALQISTDLSKLSKRDSLSIRDRISGDPTILIYCFAQHIAYHRQDYFFELLNPLRAAQIPENLREKLESRMLLLGFNTKNLESLPYLTTLSPFIEWLSTIA
ncbi:MAG TPA: hypothetical protein VE504_07240 [Nitrososphaeraceae archaeon]|jgi:hypothetical protein|nr:hypothetical protein [Nitrososphaeraceae archaeon]